MYFIFGGLLNFGFEKIKNLKKKTSFSILKFISSINIEENWKNNFSSMLIEEKFKTMFLEWK